MLSPENEWQVRENYWSQQVDHMQVLDGTRPEVHRSKRPLLACRISCKFNFVWLPRAIK